MQKHILVVSQLFYPEEFRINDICKEWIKRGYRVTVLTGIPNYPEGRYYKGYGLFKKRRETYDGVRIVRIPLIPRKNSPAVFILNYLSFVVSGFFWNLITDIKADFVFIFEVSPMTQALPGVWYAKKHKIPCYIYVQDLWPENLELIFGTKDERIFTALGKIVDYIYGGCSKIFTSSYGFIESISNRGINREKIEHWPQYAEEFYRPMERTPVAEIPDDNHFNIIFAGNIGVAQGLDILPKAAKIIAGKNPGREIRYNIVGDGRYRSEFMALVCSMELDHLFNFIPKQPANRVAELMAVCDAAVLCLTDNLILLRTVPAKLQTYMACAIPIIAVAAGETARIVTESKSGVCSPPGDAENLAENILKLSGTPSEELRKLGESGREYCKIHFDKETLLDRMDSYFK